MFQDFETRRKALDDEYNTVVNRKNEVILPGNGIFLRYRHPILSAHHAPVDWKYDLNRKTNPYLMERLGINAVFNAGAIRRNGRYLMMCRVEGSDRKSFFALAESADGVNGWEFRDKPVEVGSAGEPDVNVYDMRLTEHEDGWIYGIFCSERKDPSAAAGDTVAAVADAGIVRTRDMKNWERLPDLKSASSQQRNVVLHPEFVEGKYLLYTRPQDGFIETGSGGGICWGLSDSMNPAVVSDEKLLDPKTYHTIKEVKNGGGAPPVRTDRGWLHIVHGVRNTAAGLRYVIYALMTDLNRPWEVIARPGGYLIAPEGEERVGDVSNVVFCNGAIADGDGRLLIYYASSDTRMHVAETTLDRMVDYCMNTPEDRGSSGDSVRARLDLIRRNRDIASR